MNNFFYLEAMQSFRNIYYPNQCKMKQRFSWLVMLQAYILSKISFTLKTKVSPLRVINDEKIV